MPAAVFAWAESSGSSVDEKPRLARTSFGDGYGESAPDGLNALDQAWSVTFRKVSKSAGDDIVAFFRARFTAVNGLEYFEWTPLWSTEPVKVECESWTRTQLDDPDESDITARFKKVNRP